MASVVSLVSYPFLPAKVGGQKGIALFSKYFSRYHELVCVTIQNNDPTAAEGYKVLNILSNAPARYVNFLYFFTIRSVIRKYKASHLILEHPYYGWLGILLKWFTGIRLVVHSHNIEGLRWKTLRKWWWCILWQYEKYTHRAADYNFFIHDEDREYAISHFHLDPTRCLTMTYGIEWDKIPPKEQSQAARQSLQEKFNLAQHEHILLFNGAFNYSPNLDALEKIVKQINPLLKNKKDFFYRIIICGRDIPKEYLSMSDDRLIIAGFVEDINLYFTGGEVFINPVSEGGGIKTKLVEALGSNMNAVSTITGAVGINPEICNGKLLLAADNDWNGFADLIVRATHITADTPSAYFDHFYWGNSTRRAAEFILSKEGKK
jgi:hypothetical protein